MPRPAGGLFTRVVRQNRLQRFTVPARKGSFRRHREKIRSIPSIWFATSFTGRCGLVIYSERVNTDAEFAMIEAARVEKQDAPAREAERQKKQTDDRDLARQKNQKSFRP
jgi:hypothetical protein